MSSVPDRVGFEPLAWVTMCLALALLPYLGALPPWVALANAAAALTRLGLAWRGHGPPSAAARFVVGAATVALLFLQFHTFNGRGPGTALLCLIAGLKLLETRSRRDVQVLVMIIYFLCLAALLDGESLWLLAYVIGVSWLATATLLRMRGPATGVAWRIGLRHAGRLLAQAAPLALALWLFFPRFDGPLWQLPEERGGASSGLGDSMSPGDITDLALSDEVAFRVRFQGDTPPPAARYWRGPVLHDFDGHAWHRTDGAPPSAPGARYSGQAYHYRVSLEPSAHDWLIVLDWPAAWSDPRAVLNGDFMLVQPGPVSQAVDLEVTSYGRATATEPLTDAVRRRDTRLPPDRNPRTLQLAQLLRDAHPDDAGYIEAVLDLFRREAFYYTLTPPPLGTDSIDGFLFDSRRGFCGHYASAFAALMRAAGIPARVVTGYEGGTYNRYAGYWILRQSDAHAWDEVWLDGPGWVRVDPTAAVAPERIERGLGGPAGADAPLSGGWRQRTPWLADLRLRLDALRQVWRERILRFDAKSQDALLVWMRIPEPDGQKLALVLAGCLIAGMTWLTWQVRRDVDAFPADAVQRAFDRLCRRLSGIGIARLSHEGAEAFAARVSGLRPDLAGRISTLCRDYSRLRYGVGGPPADVRAFTAAVRRFRPRRSKPG